MKKVAYYIFIIGIFLASSSFAQEIVIEEIQQPIIEEVIEEDQSEITEEIQEIIEEEIKEDELEESKEEIFVEEFIIEKIFEISTTTSSSTEKFTVELEENASTTEEEIENATSTATSTNQVHVFLRNGEYVLIDDEIELSTEDTYLITDMNDINHEISAQSILALLSQIDEVDDSFEITQIQYYESFDSLYLKCIAVDGVEYCDNWQYLVNASSPWTGIDQTYLSDNNVLVLYFGNPYQLVFDTEEFVKDIPFNVIAQRYDYQTNTWSVREGVTIGLTVEDPENPWTPIELETQLVSENGTATFTVATSGNYMIGVQDDWYYPTYSTTVLATATVEIATTTATSTGPIDSGSGGGNSINTFDIDAAITFIKSLQETNGSYGGNELYSDWVAIAFASAGQSDPKLKSYLKSKGISKNLLDNQRRAMAILALGENPYLFNGKNFIEAIINTFDGEQLDDASLVNDDIFGLLVLTKAGYDEDDNEIESIINFIVSKQNASGLWENSADITAAAIQALYPYRSNSSVSKALTKAKNELKNSQQSDGGWGNVYTTAWVAQAMYEVGEDWEKNSNSIQDYFADIQEEDGAALDSNQSNANRIWSTSYVIPAVLEKSWNDILVSVSKQEESPEGSGSSNDDDEEIATSTNEIIEEEIIVEQYVATSTLAFEIATTTDILFIPQDSDEEIEEIIATSTLEIQIENNNLGAVSQAPWITVWFKNTISVVENFGSQIKSFFARFWF